MLTFGEVDWNSGDVGTGERSSDFMQLDDGENCVRIMSNPHQFYANWLVLPNGKKHKVNSPAENPRLMKALTDAGFKRQARWMVVVLDRRSEKLEDQKFKLLEISSQIYNGIKSLCNSKHWGEPVTGYDVVIVKGEPDSQPLYTVQPTSKIPLEGVFQEKFQAFMERVDVSKFIQPHTTEKVCELLNWNPAKYPIDGDSTPEASEESTSEGAEAPAAKSASKAPSGKDEFKFNFNFKDV